jgi:nitroreductase
MDFTELLNQRRSVRDYEEREVPLDLIEQIINDSIKAPSASNIQPWSFIVIQNREMIKRISDSSKSTILAGIERDPNSPMKGYAEILRNENFNVFYNAPCLVLIVGRLKSATIAFDCALAACYFMFSASSRGLGTCWIAQGAEVRDPELLREIGMPEGHRVYVPLIVGYPKVIPPMPDRKDPRILKVIS